MRRKPTLLFHHLKKDITVHYVTYNRFFLTDEIKSQFFGAYPNVCKITPQHIIMKNATYVHKCSKYCKDGGDSIISRHTLSSNGSDCECACRKKKYAYINCFSALKIQKNKFFFKGRNFSNYYPFLPIMLLLLEFHKAILTSIFGFCTSKQFFEVLL